MDVLGWLCDGDPAIRWQALRDLADADAATVAHERARVARTGLGAALLAQQGDDGAWHLAGEPDWVPTLFSLQLLRATGADPDDPAVATAFDRLARGFRWHESLGGRPFLDGETEPCINGGALAIGGAFARPNAALAARLAGEQQADGGWNCDAPKSARGSFHSTICVLEGLRAYERATGGAPALAAIRARGEAYLLERALSRRKSTGALIDPDFTRLAFPPRYRYDVLRALDHLRDAGAAPDPRAADAIAIVESKRRPDGRWTLEASHMDGIGVALGEEVGAPSRWITLRALRVLRWFGRA